MNYISGNIEPLTKENFHKWRAQTQLLLMENNRWQYVSGEKIRTTENAAEWDIADRRARTDIILAINPEALMQINNYKTSKEVWDKLNEIYCLSYSTYKTMLMKQLLNYKMQEDGNMKAHIKNFCHLIDKLKEIRVFIQDDVSTILLLRSIPNSYEDFRIATETEENFPSFGALKIRLIIEEFKRRHDHLYGISTYHRIHSGITAKRRIQAITSTISHQTLYEEIITILRDADYRTMTLKKLRLTIEAKYNTDLNNRESEIYFLVMQYIKANSASYDPILINDTEDESESDDEIGEE